MKVDKGNSYTNRADSAKALLRVEEECGRHKEPGLVTS